MIGRFLCWLGLHKWIVRDESFVQEALDGRCYLCGPVIMFCPRCKGGTIVNLVTPQWVSDLEKDRKYPEADETDFCDDTKPASTTPPDAPALLGYLGGPPEAETPKKKRGRPRKTKKY